MAAYQQILAVQRLIHITDDHQAQPQSASIPCKDPIFVMRTPNLTLTTMAFSSLGREGTAGISPKADVALSQT